MKTLVAIWITLLLIGCVLFSQAQNPSTPYTVLYGAGAPGNAYCTAATLGVVYTQTDGSVAQKLWACKAAGSWEQQGGAVSSVFGRTGVVVAATNDYAFSNLSGSLACSQAPALTGDATTSAGSCATVLGTITNTVTSYNGINTVGNGLPSILALVDATSQTANIGTTTLYAVPSSGAGLYELCTYVVVQVVGGTSTMPSSAVAYTDADNSAAESITMTTTSTGNTLTTKAQGCMAISAKASTNITYSTSNYASTGATMNYALHIKLFKT